MSAGQVTTCRGLRQRLPKAASRPCSMFVKERQVEIDVAAAAADQDHQISPKERFTNAMGIQ